MADAVVATDASGAAIPPNQSLYLNNLNPKVPKAKLKESLYQVFSPFGKILDVIAIKTKELRGQAWVVFADVGAASTALRQMQSFPFYDKPMRIQFAKEKSDSAAKADGTFKGPREKRKREGGSAGGAPPAKRAATGAATAVSAPLAVGAPAAASAAALVAIPSPTLLVTGLPSEVNKEMLQALFGAFAGLKEVRHVPERGLALVDYSNEATATPALLALNNFQISPTAKLSIAYAPKA